MSIRDIDFYAELKFQFSLSSGKGGQHVNKVSTAAELFFNVNNSELLNEDQKTRIKRKLKNRINKEGELHLSEQSTRSQIKNKQLLVKKFYQLLEESLKIPKPRKATKPSKSAVAERLKDKRIVAEKKQRRKPNDF
jgi:ribosome-associated protein